MNKYSFDLPYDYTKYANVRGFVYANSEEEAREKAKRHENWYDEEFEDSDDSGDSYYNYDALEIELETENVTHVPISSLIASESNPYPDYFLAELHLV
ncbi:MAG: hypothetical protein K1X86_00235 [Ignavibacteria bacterium]|nr:hypothetical protein [Ignavibacteria bacterium]